MKKELNGESWMLIILIILSICSYLYLYENQMVEKATSFHVNSNIESKKRT